MLAQEDIRFQLVVMYGLTGVVLSVPDRDRRVRGFHVKNTVVDTPPRNCLAVLSIQQRR